MAPSADRLEAALRSAVEEVYRSEDQNNLTVRFVRDKVENELGLDPGFFVGPEWKDKSKSLIKSWATKLIDEDEAHAPTDSEIKPEVEAKSSYMKKPESPSRKRTKAATRDVKQPRRKRQKKDESSSEDDVAGASTEESTVSDSKDSDDSDAGEPQKGSELKSKAKSKSQSKKKAKVKSDESEDDVSEPFMDSDEESDAPTKAEPRPHSSTNLENADEKPANQDDDSDSEAAMMIDEKPKPKQKRRSKSEASSSSKAPKPKPAAKELSPDEAQIKTLQSHLLKCGVRKIWGIELKKFGDDNKQKIRHLQGMLRDVGMTGRFSEQRAKEIKELRELQADLEAVTEGDSKWGLQSGKRARGQRKVLKEVSDEDEDEAEDDGDDAYDDGDHTKKNIKGEREKADDKAARAKQELAFLGDEESDSD